MWIPYAVTTIAMVIVATAGIFATDIGPWYRELIKPSWQPPDWLFGPAWTSIYICIIFSVGMVWNRAAEEAQTTIIILLLINFVLNILWSFLFFKLRRPDLALLEVVFLWLSIVSLIVYFKDIHVLSSWLLVPYLVWVSFASFLTLTIVRLNAPFGKA